MIPYKNGDLKEPCILVYFTDFYWELVFFLSLCFCVYLSVCLYLCLSFCHCFRLCLSLCLFVSICLPACLSVCLSICLSFSLCVCMSACLSICLPVCLSLSKQKQPQVVFYKKKLFLKISQYSQENTYVGVSLFGTTLLK